MTFTADMQFFTFVSLGLSLLCSLTSVSSQSSSVDAYIAKESPIAKAGLLANIGSSGAKSNGAKVGNDAFSQWHLTMQY